MTSLRFRALGPVLRKFGRRAIAQASDPVVERKRFAMLARRLFRAPPGFTAQVDTGFCRAGNPSIWVRNKEPSGRVILHLHGGGYLVGDPRTHWKPLAHLAQASGMDVFLPAYRLAPEHPLPAACEDAIAAWQYLRDAGYQAKDIAIGGDSAGGGLAAGLMAHLCGQREYPGAVYLWSPFLDFSFSGASVGENAMRDHFFSPDRTPFLQSLVLGDLAADDPRASPLFASFSHPPPVWISASQCEMLRDDAVRFAELLHEKLATVVLDLQADLPHVWQLMAGWIPEADQSIRDTARFLVSHMPLLTKAD